MTRPGADSHRYRDEVETVPYRDDERVVKQSSEWVPARLR
jgi:hypothetical protein